MKKGILSNFETMTYGIAKGVYFPREVAKFKAVVVVWFLNMHLNPE
jgi:hypothetical protein